MAVSRRINRRTVALCWLIAAAVAASHKGMQYVSGWGGVSSRAASSGGSSSRLAMKAYNSDGSYADPYLSEDNKSYRPTAAAMLGGYIGAWACAASAAIAGNPVVGIPAVTMVGVLFMITFRRSNLSSKALPWEPFGAPKGNAMPWEPYGAPTGPQGWQVASEEEKRSSWEEILALRYGMSRAQMSNRDQDLAYESVLAYQDSSPDLSAWTRNKVLWHVDVSPDSGEGTMEASPAPHTEHMMSPASLREMLNMDQAVSVMRSDKTWCNGTVIDVQDDALVTVQISGTTKMKKIGASRVQEMIRVN